MGEYEPQLIERRSAGVAEASPECRRSVQFIICRSCKETPIALTTGTSVGPYEIVALLGMGAMGEVYHARDTRLNRIVALKILSGQLRTLPEHHDRFMQEAQLASSLQHPNIVTIFDIGPDGALTYLAMELVRGRPLDHVIAPGGLATKDALRYAIEIADALSTGMARHVHRDLKPRTHSPRTGT